MRALRGLWSIRARRYDSCIPEPPALSRRFAEVLVGLFPAGVAAAWLPLRDELPNTDLALVLVATIATVGFLAGRTATAVGAGGCAVTFDLLHTRPYGHLAITHGKDELTTALLLLVGLAMGELGFRLGRYRRMARSDADAYALVSDAAGLVATGGEAHLVIEALAEELRSGLGLEDCVFTEGPPTGEVPFIARDGTLVNLDDFPERPAPAALDLPIWSSGAITARFRLLQTTGSPRLTKAQMQLAVSVADQAGAALAASPAPTDPPEPAHRGLRLLRS